MRFSIGEFSRITSLSIKSLRLYHDKGILIPSSVDSSSGYRYYNDDNIETARAIGVLKTFDFSLAEIKEILNSMDQEADLLLQLQSKLKAIQDKIDRYKAVSHSLEAIITQERENAMNDQQEFEIEEKELETLLIAAHRMRGQYHEVGKGFSLIYKHLGRQVNGKPMTLYYDQEYKENDADFEACLPIRKGKKAEGIEVRELTGGKAITLIHKGPYSDLGQSYKRIFNYINENGLEPASPSREVYLKGPGMIFKGNPKNYLTEIQILVG